MLLLPFDKAYGTIDIGPFKADIRRCRGEWQFRPYHTVNPTQAAAITMNALIRDVGRIWTAVPEGEIEHLIAVLESLGRL